MYVERVERNKINQIDVVLCMSKELKEIILSYPLCCRMVKKVSYREYHRHCDEDPEPPEISDQAYKAGSFIKCLLCWAWRAIEAIHEGAESFMISLLEDANLLANHARRITVQPQDIQLAQHIRGDKDWSYLGYKD